MAMRGVRGARGGSAAKRRHKPAQAINFADLEGIKQIVLRRHPEWRGRKRGHYVFYLAVFLIVLAGIYFLSVNGRALSPLAYFLIFSVTVLLAAAFLLMIRYHLGLNSSESLEEMVESEILRFTHERSGGRRS